MRWLLPLLLIGCKSPDAYSGYVEYTEDQRETGVLDSDWIVTGGLMLTWRKLRRIRLFRRRAA